MVGIPNGPHTKKAGPGMREGGLTVVIPYLEPEADGQDEATDTADETREEGVEGEGAHQAAVNKLKDSRQEHVQQVAVHDLKLGGRVRPVLGQEFGSHTGQGGGAGGGAGVAAASELGGTGHSEGFKEYIAK